MGRLIQTGVRIWAEDVEAADLEVERLKARGDAANRSDVLRRWIRRGRLQEEQAREAHDG